MCLCRIAYYYFVKIKMFYNKYKDTQFLQTNTIPYAINKV